MKKIYIILALCLFSAGFLKAANTSVFVGNKDSKKFHYHTCRYVKQISDKNIVFFYTIKEAQEAGYIPCKICKPILAENIVPKQEDRILLAIDKGVKNAP